MVMWHNWCSYKIHFLLNTDPIYSSNMIMWFTAGVIEPAQDFYSTKSTNPYQK
jgi:hypothetical protein